jgi:hypothetical protein
MRKIVPRKHSADGGEHRLPNQRERPSAIGKVPSSTVANVLALRTGQQVEPAGGAVSVRNGVDLSAPLTSVILGRAFSPSETGVGMDIVWCALRRCTFDETNGMAGALEDWPDTSGLLSYVQ